MGSKSSSAPAPDPRLVEAQINSINQQTKIGDRIVGLSEQAQPLQQEQLRFGLDSARTAFDQSQDDRAFMLSRRGLLAGQQNRMVQDAQAFNTDARRDELAGQALGDVNQAFADSNGQAMRGLTRMGVNPNSGRALMVSNLNSIAQANAQASAWRKVREAARLEGFALTDRATNALAGYPSLGMQASALGAGFGTSGLALANQGLAGMTSGYGTAAGIAGNVANGATNAYASQSNAYLNGMGTDQTGSILGAVGGMAAAYFGAQKRAGS